MRFDAPSGVFAHLVETVAKLGFQALCLSPVAASHDVLLASSGPGQPLLRMPPIARAGCGPLRRFGRRCEGHVTWSLPQAKPHMAGKYGAVLARIGVAGGLSVPFHHAGEYWGIVTLGLPAGLALSDSQADDLACVVRFAVLQALSLDRSFHLDVAQGHADFGDLSPRQIEIMKWVAQGKTNREIGIITNTRHRTVDYHLQEILRKLRVVSRAQAVALYMARGGDEAGAARAG